ncbi:DEAD/DEAH box helicase [Dawidia soli]|uniref:DEAD/DEAH box helicase n=1 Tax=Dawidia soli TaxID=2782352 RepID=A0AAP2DD89_9BACT|nr:DEAD/DEAH box helicase [Dawidia soli]MBT1689544.1 DEAD/DEAH box helicase [Dawidia soli]
MKFEQYRISDAIKSRLAELGFKRPTDIQFKAIPPILQGDDVLAIAQTGTGKTAAFVIPVLHKLVENKQYRVGRYQVKCLVMVPTRELAVQIADVFHDISKNLDVNIVGIYGGVEQEEQIRQLGKGVDVLIATPGRMFDLINQQKIDLGMLRILILDEADHMLDLGFIRDIRDVQKHIAHRHQTLFFSATIDARIKEIAYSIVRNPIRIQISPENPVSKNVSHGVAFIEMDDKRFFLERFARQHEGSKMLVFVRTKVRAERVAAAMQRVNIATLTMHGGKEQGDRLTVMDEFKKGQTRILITTDVNARGIDIPNVDYVINYDLPDEPENYVHRVGRTGRGVQKGTAISFCSTEERPVLEEIQEYLGKPIEELVIDKADYRGIVSASEEMPADSNWRKLIEDHNKASENVRRKKKKK